MSFIARNTFLPAAASVLRARVVLPVSGPPIEDGAVSLLGNRVIGVGRWRDWSVSSPANVVDLGQMILLPGLVNAHCHLDYTHMAGEIPPQRSFVDWIQMITTCKSGWIYSDFAESWLAGAKMLLNTGTTTVGDIEMVPELLPDVWSATPLRVISFLELTGVKSRRPPSEILQEALHKITSLPRGRCRAGLSPHAPYSTQPELLRLAGESARRHELPLVTHVAESDEEFDMFTHGKGKMFEWLKRNGRDMGDCGHGSPVAHLASQGMLSANLTAIHVNYLAPGDAGLLAKHRVSVAHCPRSHAFFKHRRFPLAELAAEGINICLGTDSLASMPLLRKKSPELNLFDEMRELATAVPTLRPETILQMATQNGAAALGAKRQFGEITAGAFADLIALPHSGRIRDAHDTVVHHRGNVSASMIDGEWAIAPETMAIEQ